MKKAKLLKIVSSIFVSAALAAATAVSSLLMILRSMVQRQVTHTVLIKFSPVILTEALFQTLSGELV